MPCHCHEGFCSDYLVVKPEEAGMHELIALLWSHKVGEREFMKTPEGKEVREFKQRWLIFMSVLFQKLLIHINKPMAWVGYWVLVWLNLLASHVGLVHLLLDFIRGTVKIPEKESEKFRSMLGNADPRLEMDPNIQMGHPKYKGALSILASKLAYENPAFIKSILLHHWQMDLLGAYNFWNDFQGQFSTHAFMCHNPNPKSNLIVVSFRGTDPIDSYDYRTDVDISWCELPGVGRIHSGFMKALGLQRKTGWPKEISLGPAHHQFAYYTIRQKLREVFKENKEAKFIVTGHSMGGALAILFAAVLMLHEEKEILERLEGVYTFGQPRVGDKRFGDFMMEKLKVYNVKYYRFVYGADIVPRLPFDDACFYKHFGPCLFYNSLYNGKVLKGEPNMNYFSLKWMIPTHINAMWELIRGFILPYTKGHDFKECWLQKMFRLLGLLIPGFSAHGPQDYCNLTRLGPSLLSSSSNTQLVSSNSD